MASSAGGGYEGSGLDGSKISLYAVTADGAALDKVEAAIDATLDDIIKNGVTAAELDRAKNGYIAEYVYDNDNQNNMARRYGWGIAVGRTVKQIESWPDDIAKVTLDDIKKVAGEYLDMRRSVTGTLIPTAPDASEQVAKPAPPAPANRS